MRTLPTSGTPARTRLLVAVPLLAVLGAGVVQAAAPAAARGCDGVKVACAIGDTGPGGGIVFYDAGSRQSWGRYLEVAPTGWASASVPGAPRHVSVAKHQGHATVSWQAPASGGRSLHYVVSTIPASKGCRTAKLSCSVQGLKAGRSYTFTVRAVNGAGSGKAAKVTKAPRPVRSLGLAAPMAAPDPGLSWCPQSASGYGTTLPTNPNIGTGHDNTAIIVRACGRGSAAGRAAAYRGGGKSDWFLPSKDELNQLWSRKSVVSGLVDGNFWSSSQNTHFPVSAWCQNFANGAQGDNYKDDGGRVRPIRAF